MARMMAGFPREKVKLVKKDQTIINDIDALLSKSSALIEDVSIKIEEGDYLFRNLPNGIEEKYLVTDNGYSAGSGHGIPPHYQVKLKKVTTILFEDDIQLKNQKNCMTIQNISMKERLIEVVNAIPRIEANFKHYVPPEGYICPEYDYIYDNHEFIQWIEVVKFLLQDIYDRSGDNYIGSLINSSGIIHKFNGKHFNEREMFCKLKSALNLICQNIDKYYFGIVSDKGEDKIVKKPMLFISHASADIKYVQPLVDLFADIGLNNQTMFCSSVPDYHIPMDNDIYEYLKELFNNYELHVIFVLSENYYKSAACMNEMGAAWVLQSRYSTILLPGFDFSAIKGAVNPSRIALKLGNDNIDELKTRLGELKDIISAEFDISVPGNRWENKRNDFIKLLDTILIDEI